MTHDNRFNKDERFWAQYLKGRPAVPDSFFTKIIDYHTQQGGAFGLLHEAGAGAGIHTNRLAKAFQHVIVSDPAEMSIEQAKSRLHECSNCEFKVAGLEDSSGIQQGSVDIIVGLNMIHFVNPIAMVKAVDFQLKSGGTLVLATFAYLVLDDPKAQKIWEEIFVRAGEDLMIRREELKNTKPWSPRTILATDLDAVPCPEDIFRPGTRRVRINYPKNYSYAKTLVPDRYLDRYVTNQSRTSPNDVLQFETNDDWNMDLTSDRLLELFRSHPLREETEGVPELWKQLRDIIGEGTIPGRWAINMILATKK